MCKNLLMRWFPIINNYLLKVIFVINYTYLCNFSLLLTYLRRNCFSKKKSFVLESQINQPVWNVLHVLSLRKLFNFCHPKTNETCYLSNINQSPCHGIPILVQKFLYFLKKGFFKVWEIWNYFQNSDSIFERSTKSFSNCPFFFSVAHWIYSKRKMCFWLLPTWTN